MQSASEPNWRSALSSPYFVPACFALFISLRVGLLIAVPIEQHSDNLWYYARGVALASGEGYSEGGIATAYWPPGWPGFLGLVFWLFGPSALVGQIANLMFSTMIFFISLSLGSVIFADAIVGRLTVALLTIYPNQIGYVPILATETFYTALLLAALAIVVRGRHSLAGLVLAGLVFGIATLTKAQTLFVPAFLFAAWWLADAGRLRLFPWIAKAAIVYAAMALVIVPWTVRNYLVLGEFVLISSNGGGTLLSGNNPTAWGDYTEDDPLVRQVPNDVAGQVANDRLARSLAFQWISNNPGAFAILIPKKVWRLWAPDGEAEWAYQAGFNDYDRYWMLFRLVRGLNQLYYVCLIAAFLASPIFYFRQRAMLSRYAVTGYVLVAYFTAISIVFSGQSRLHFPLMPWIAMYAAWTITQWTGKSEPAARPAAVAEA
jgi:hypothetical protein